MRKRNGLGLGLALALGWLAAPTPSGAVTINVLTYNTEGLPPPARPDRTAQVTAMSPLLQAIPGTAILALQEVFSPSYYGILTGPVYAYESSLKASTPPELVGDGLTLLSDFPAVAGYAATQWSNCFGDASGGGGDCLAEKGFAFARITFSPNVVVDFYNLHADAGSDSASATARRANITQLVTAINATSVGRAVIVAGDTNSLYTRDSDNIATLLAGAGLTDTWVWLANGGVVPGFGAPNNSGCPPPRGTGSDGSGPNCELVDKIFFRSGTSVQVTALDYDVLTSFVDGTGASLSDHLPVLAQLEVSLVPEPALGLLLIGALAALRYARGSTRQ